MKEISVHIRLLFLILFKKKNISIFSLSFLWKWVEWSAILDFLKKKKKKKKKAKFVKT